MTRRRKALWCLAITVAAAHLAGFIWVAFFSPIKPGCYYPKGSQELYCHEGRDGWP